MFEVFAVDPATVARSWDTFRGTVGRMGPDEGRLIADFPSAQGGQNWSTVVRAITRQLPDVERSRIMARLARVRAVGVTHRYARGKSWLENVITAHGRAAWHAVLTDDVACTLPVTLRPADAEDREGLFSVPHHAIVPREATAIVETLAPLLHVSRRLLLVDPHFMDHGIARWTPIPSALIEEARKGPAPLAETIVHTAVGRDRNGDVRHGRGEWRQRLHQELAPRLPRNVRVRVVRWDQVGKADPMHGRYVLTDLGGVQIDWGIDERIGGRTDVHRLTSAGWTERMNEFDPAFAGAPFDDVTVTAS